MRTWIGSALLAALLLGPLPASAALYDWATYEAGDVDFGAVGALTTADGTRVGVTVWLLEGTLPFIQFRNATTNYWIPSTPYLSDEVGNAPATPDLIGLGGGQIDGQPHRYRIDFTEPVSDPVMAVVSMGSADNPITYEFDRDFEILSSGAGYFGGDPNGSLSKEPGNVLLGVEGHGTIQFAGLVSSIEWTVPTADAWHGFNVGVTTVPIPGAALLLASALAGLAWVRRRAGV